MINGELAGTRIGRNLSDEPVIVTEDYSDGSLESVRVENASRGQYRCTACGETYDSEEGDGKPCPSPEFCDDEDCECKGVHPCTVEPVPFAWFNHATVRVDEVRESVALLLSVDDERGAFEMTISRTPEGRVFLHLPDMSSGAAKHVHDVRRVGAAAWALWEQEPAPADCPEVRSVGHCPACHKSVTLCDSPVWTCPTNLAESNPHHENTPPWLTEEIQRASGDFSNCAEDHGGSCDFQHMPLHGACYDSDTVSY